MPLEAATAAGSDVHGSSLGAPEQGRERGQRGERRSPAVPGTRRRPVQHRPARAFLPPDLGPGPRSAGRAARRRSSPRGSPTPGVGSPAACTRRSRASPVQPSSAGRDGRRGRTPRLARRRPGGSRASTRRRRCAAQPGAALLEVGGHRLAEPIGRPPIDSAACPSTKADSGSSDTNSAASGSLQGGLPRVATRRRAHPVHLDLDLPNVPACGRSTCPSRYSSSSARNRTTTWIRSSQSATARGTSRRVRIAHPVVDLDRLGDGQRTG